MKLVIDIDEDAYKEIKKIVADGNEMCFMQKLIANGIPLPKGHGRLIDADALEYDIATLESDSDVQFEYIDKQDVADAPTIIEADGGAE